MLRLWAWVGVWRNCMLSPERQEVPYRGLPDIRQCHSHPCTSPTLTSQHTDTSSNWHLAPIKTIVHHILTQISLALRVKSTLVPNWQGSSTSRRWCLSPYRWMFRKYHCICKWQIDRLREQTDRETEGNEDVWMHKQTDSMDNILHLTLMILLSVSSSDAVWATRNDPRNFDFCFRIFSHWMTHHRNVSDQFPVSSCDCGQAEIRHTETLLTEIMNKFQNCPAIKCNRYNCTHHLQCLDTDDWPLQRQQVSSL